MIPKILFIGHSYHQVTKSSAFFLDQLELLGSVTTEVDDCFNGEVKPHYLAAAEPYDMVVVWQLPQVIRQFVGAGHRKNIVYVPMYDAVHKLDAGFWQSLKQIKILCFSSTLQAICLTHGLDSLFIQYYPDWVGSSPVGYSGKSLFFWQRRPWPNWQTVAAILPVAQFEKMHHHVAIDPGYEMATDGGNGPTPAELSNGRLDSSVWFDDKSELLEKLREFNVFFLPRKREGIGLSFLDAMKMGMIPVGLDRATYNEYVVHGLNGFIVNEKIAYLLPDLEAPARASKHYFLKGRANYLRGREELREFFLRPVTSPEPTRISLLQRGPWMLRRWTNRWFGPVGNDRQRTHDSPPLVSIIVTVRDDMDGFMETHRSICGQSFKSVEYIVVDRNSRDGTRERIGRNRTSIDQLIDQPHGTRTDALKVAAGHASGRYLLVLAAGDQFTKSTALEEAMRDAPPDAAVIYGHSFADDGGGSIRLKLAADLNETYRLMSHGIPAALQTIPARESTFVGREIFLQDGVPADHHELLIAACSRGSRMYHSNTVIATCGAKSLNGKKKAALARKWREIALRYGPGL